VGATGPRHEVRRQPQPPPTYIPSPIYRERRSDGKLRRCRHSLDRRCPCANLNLGHCPRADLLHGKRFRQRPCRRRYTSPLSSLCPFMHHIFRIHTVTVYTRVDLHLVDPKSINFLIQFYKQQTSNIEQMEAKFTKNAHRIGRHRFTKNVFFKKETHIFGFWPH
jgi:hypothetical protein